MTDLERDCLRALRVFGPCSNAEIGRRLGLPPDRTYRAVKALELKGLAVHPKLQTWDISRKGRRLFQERESKPLGLFQPEPA